ncbi:MAG: accessory Sec system translocase SecA2 [Lachnospiraceae bacterium]|nr:accessory Sec system translocase SecA2 [Lachnospiraceae bacterium]
MRHTRRLKKLKQIVNQIRDCGKRIEKLTDKELAKLTPKFKKRLEGGESLDDILPEAFAAICEADKRILGMMPYDVQILGGIALHQGYLTEMNTGEGKTLAATMPLYLNALTGKSTILVTANEYLASRDAQEMGPVYQFMGLSVASGVNVDSAESITNQDKKAIYEADIVYTTHGALGFDYLIHNLVTTDKDRFLREFYYVIIDEADSVLLDAAQTPLVISGSPRVQSNLYGLADFFVTTLVEDEDYEQEKGAVWLTKKGIRYAETFFQIDNFYDEKYFEINRHVTLALRAHTSFRLGEAYMVADGELVLLNGGTGRMMKGMKLRGGQHQALEAKEKLDITQESRSVAAITFQNLFLLFPKMAGMSGTMADASGELWDVYGSKVLVIPPNRIRKRKDLPDRYFRNSKRQLRAASAEIAKIHRSGRPVLVVAASIRDTEQISEDLTKKKIPHNLLNANNAFWEAEIIKEAGQRGAVTVATSIAGRGTDIKLGIEVENRGGLAVIGIGRMENVRLERQARGRAGRQGDAGTSQFFLSLEDDVVGIDEDSKLYQCIEEKKRISRRKLKKVINKAQTAVEESGTLVRKRSVDYDKVMQRQRDLIYETRNRLLDGDELQMGKIIEMAVNNIERFLKSEESLDQQSINRYILDNISYRLDEKGKNILSGGNEKVEEYLLERVGQGLAEQGKKLGNKSIMNDFMRMAVLSAIDDAWVEQVDYLQQLQAAVSGRATAQRNLLFEYQNDAFESYEKMQATVYQNAMRNILLSNVFLDKERKIHILFP